MLRIMGRGSGFGMAVEGERWRGEGRTLEDVTQAILMEKKLYICTYIYIVYSYIRT